MAKLFAVTIVLIAILSAIPVIRNTWHPVPDISTHGQAIDDQLSDTMWEAGISFLASQILLAWFIWKFSGGATGLVAAAFILVGVEVFALGIFGAKAWANLYFTQPGADAMPVQVQAGQFAFYFRYPGPDGSFGPIHPELVNEGTQNFYGLDLDH